MIVGTARRWALLLVASALAAGPVVVLPAASAASSACAANSPCVHITFPDSTYAPVDVSAGQLADESDITQATYAIRYASHATGSETVTAGTSVRAVLATIHPTLDLPDKATYIYIHNPNNDYVSPLQPGDLDYPSPFQDPTLEPAFAVQNLGDPQIEYIRPLRSNDDVNGSDFFQTGTQTTTIDMQVYTSDSLALHPKAYAGKGPWSANDPVTFSASLPGSDPPHDGVTYSWMFAPGDPYGPATPSNTTTHRYAQNNKYRVVVTVGGTGPDGQTYTGTSLPVTVQVGPVQKHKDRGTKTRGNGDGKKNHPSSGPTKAHGKHEGSAPSGGPTLAPPSTTTGSVASGPGGVSPSSPVTSAVTAPSSAGRTSSTPPAAAAGAFVQGVLITRSPAAATAAASASDATLQAASARRPARVDTSFDARWLWFLAPILLLIGGALGERRRIPHRHGPRSRT